MNAYYDNSVNALFIPAGILQPPFFNDTSKMQVNFGGIGSIVGHEMTHGYDNLGAHFDSNSNIRDWFSPASLEEFKKRMECIAALFSGFQIADTQVRERQRARGMARWGQRERERGGRGTGTGRRGERERLQLMPSEAAINTLRGCYQDLKRRSY